MLTDKLRKNYGDAFDDLFPSNPENEPNQL